MVLPVSTGTVRNIHDLSANIRLLNLCYWWWEMAINCPKHGWIDATNDYCGMCGACARSGK